MAEYTQTTTYGASLQDKIRMWNNITTQRFVERFNSLIKTEFDGMVGDVDGYTITQATWDKAVQKALADLNNETNRRCFKWYLDLMAVEFVEIASTGLGAARSQTQLTARRCFETASNTIHRELVHEIIDLHIVELDLIEATS